VWREFHSAKPLIGLLVSDSLVDFSDGSNGPTFADLLGEGTMKRVLLFAVIASTGCLVHPDGTVQVATPAVVVAPPPPPPQRPIAVVRPGFVWIDGHHAYRGGRYVWVEGRYELDRSGHRWVQGRWARRGNGHVWVEGHWARR
jgi:hypothetical protein